MRADRLACSVDTHLQRQVQLYGGSGRLGHLFAVIATVPRPVLLAVVGVVLAGRCLSSPAVEPRRRRPFRRRRPTVAAVETRRRRLRARRRHRGRQGQAGRPGLPSPVARALDAKKTVVILFWNKGGVEDRSVKNSVDRLSRRGGKTAVVHRQGREPLQLHANHRGGQRHPDARARDREPEGPGRGPERLLRLPDDPPVRAERRPPLTPRQEYSRDRRATPHLAIRRDRPRTTHRQMAFVANVCTIDHHIRCTSRHPFVLPGPRAAERRSSTGG